MRISVYLPLVMSLILAAGGPALARRLAPRTAARALSVAALVTSASALWALGLLALSLLLAEHKPALATLGDSTPRSAAVIALIVAVAGLLRLGRVARERWRALSRARVFSCGHPAGEGGLVVVAGEQPFAAALPGRNGRIVVSTAMLARLGARERRVLLSHERCHVTHRHDLYRLASDLACAVNPLLGAVSASVAQALERWADEQAATAVGSRPLVARTLLQAALAPVSAPVGLAFSSRGVPARVQALYGGPIDSRRSAAAAMLLLALLAAAASTDATFAIERLLHLFTLGLG